MEIFFQLGMIIIVATLGGFLARFCRQPLIPAYILAGVVLGPWLALITNSDIINTLSLTGIAFLLFIVGLELDVTKLRDIGHVATIGGIVQVLLTFVFGFLLSRLLGFSDMHSLYLGIILSFSSTMVVIKLLGDKRELTTLHGRIVIGILLIQDIVAIFALSALSTLNSFFANTFFIAMLKALGVLVIMFLCSKYVFPRIFSFFANSQELLFLGALSVCFLFSFVFDSIGLSIAIGAFVAGVSLAGLPYNIEIVAKVKSLRDFFSTIFFVSLGLNISFLSLWPLLKPLLWLTLFVIVIKPFIVLLLVTLFGHAKRTSFLSAVSLAQVSEFSLILAAQGVVVGHITQDIFTLTVLLAMLTIAATSYFVKFDSLIYRRLSSIINRLDFVDYHSRRLQYLPEEQRSYDAVLVGYDRIGYDIFTSIKRSKKSFLVVDFNPDIIKRLIAQRIPCIYGDIGDEEILDRLDFKKTQLVISTVPTFDVNAMLIYHVKRQSHKAVIYVTSDSVEDALQLYHKGADYVILPHFLGGERVSTMVEQFTGDLQKTTHLKYTHMDELKRRMLMRHEHPRK